MLAGAVAVSLAAIACSALAAPWFSAGAEALRQTVPLTPPATWTPAAPPTPWPDPTVPVPPVAQPPAPDDPNPPDAPTEPTALPPAGEPDPNPTAPAAAPAGPETAPTQAPAGAQPWLGLSARPQIVAPGTVVTLRLEIVNLGPADLTGATVTLGPVPHLTLRPSGSARVVAGELRWSTPRLAAGEGVVVEVQAVVGGGLLPGEEIVFAAGQAWGGGEVNSNDGLLRAPQAMLPEVGLGRPNAWLCTTPRGANGCGGMRGWRIRKGPSVSRAEYGDLSCWSQRFESAGGR